MPGPVPRQSPRDEPDEPAEEPHFPFGHAPDHLFLGHFSEEDVRGFLAHRGFWDTIAARGYPEARVRIESVPADAPRLVFHEGTLKLAEVRAHREVRSGRPLLVIDWIEIRDPRRSFTADRPPLPGQRAPSLGVGRDVIELLAHAGRRIDALALVATPQHFHNAILYARSGLRYAAPDVRARFEALEAALQGLSLGEASWRVERGEVVDPSTDLPVEWAHYAKEQELTL